MTIELARDMKLAIAANRIDIWLNRAKIAAALEAGASQRPDLDHVILSIEANLRRAGKGKRLVIANGAEAEVFRPLEAAVKQVGGNDPVQPPQPHLRQRVHMRNQPPASAAEYPVGQVSGLRGSLTRRIELMSKLLG